MSFLVSASESFQRIRHCRVSWAYLPRFAAILIGVGLLSMVWPMHKNAWKLSETQHFITAAPLRAFQANLDAYNAFTWEARSRRQLILTLASLEAKGWENLKLHSSAADRAYEISISSAPHNPVVIAARLQHLFMSNRWEESGEEIEELLARMKKYGSQQPPTWFFEATWAGTVGDEKRLVAAIHNGLQLDEPTFSKYAEDLGVVIR